MAETGNFTSATQVTKDILYGLYIFVLFFLVVSSVTPRVKLDMPKFVNI